MSELALQKDIVLEYICDGVNGLGYKQEVHGMVSPRLFLTSDLQCFLKESSPASWKKVRKHFSSDEEMTEAIEAQLYEDILSSQNVATFFKQKLNSFTFQGEPFFLFFASGSSIGGQVRDFDKNIFSVVPELAYRFEHEGKQVFSFRPDLAFFVNGVYFGYCELKSTIDGQTAEKEGRRKIANDYVEMVEQYARLAYTNDVTETLRRRMLHVFEKAIHVTTCDLSSLYVVRTLSTLTKGLKTQFVNNEIYRTDAVDQVAAEIKEYPKVAEGTLDPVAVFKETFARFYAREEVEKEIRYYNFLEYTYNNKEKSGTLLRSGNTGTLISPRPKQKFGVDKVLTRLREFLKHEGEPNYYIEQLRKQLEAQKLSPERIEQILEERNKILNNKYVYSLLLQYAAGFGKSNIIGWLASMMSDMREEGTLVFDKILIVVDRIQLRNQLNEMMHNMNLSRVNFTDVTNRRELINAMNDDNVRVAVVNIQKFNDFEQVIAERGLGTKQMRVAFIIDEIHRTNSGKLHDEMRSSFESLQDALERPYIEGEAGKSRKKNVIIGLTATPSDTVLARFGEFLKTEDTRPIWVPFDSYTMKEAIEEGYVLNPAAHIYKWVVAMEYTVPAGMSNEEEQYALRKKQIYNNDARIRNIAQKIVERLYTTVYPSIRGYGKAMLATSSIESAIKYVTEIRKEIARRGTMPRFNDAKVYIVYSDRQDMPSASTYNEGKSEAEVIEAFQKGKNGLIIVVDKLQTGFDEKLLHTLFLDKEISGINAIQTICRVNRTTKNKHKVDCHVIDISHKNVNIHHLKEALAKYSDLTFTILEPLQALDKLHKIREELMGEELYCLYFRRFVELHKLEPTERTTALNEVLLKIEEWIRREMMEAQKRMAAGKETTEGADDKGFVDRAKQLKKSVQEYLITIFNFNGIIEIDQELREPYFMGFWEHYKRIYNTITRNPSSKSEIGVQLDDAGFLPATSLEITATVYPEDKGETALPKAPDANKKPANGGAAKVDSVEEFVKRLNLEEEMDRELIDAGHQLEQDFLKYVETDSKFQNMIHTEGGFFPDEKKRAEFGRLIRRFRRTNSDNYPEELHGYLEHYQDRLYDCAMGWKPVGYEEEEEKTLEVPEIRDYSINQNEHKSMAAENNQSPYKKVKQNVEQLEEEMSAHFKFVEWDGQPFEHHDAEELQATKQLVESPNYFEVIPTGKESTKDNSLYLTITQAWFDKIISGEKTVEYREIKPTTISKYLDLRESSDGYIITNQNLPEESGIYPEAYNEGIFSYVPRYYEYLSLGVGYRKDRDTATVRIKGFGFIPERYHKGGVWRTDMEDDSFTDEQWQEAFKKGANAVQDMLYKADGPETNWTFAIHLGEVVEVHKK
ncbi:hypothetical protein IX308_000131 [Porphyromonas levii]|uniref:DEAD/DEAH box helicase family protein n=1 Tax=Porphyromonas levii TaxID=28114 RepID=UPI001BA4E812|nr:DEAD/DEAH box helicase family protein [Porphyromonas levii]MBR8783973.1 hypothetical protein [Porphyromonas levii]